MGTVTKEIADDVIAGKYDQDNPIKIIKYTNAWGGEGYGLICKGQRTNQYEASSYIINPTVYWERKK